MKNAFIVFFGSHFHDAETVQIERHFADKEVTLESIVECFNDMERREDELENHFDAFFDNNAPVEMDKSYQFKLLGGNIIPCDDGSVINFMVKVSYGNETTCFMGIIIADDTADKLYG